MKIVLRFFGSCPNEIDDDYEEEEFWKFENLEKLFLFLKMIIRGRRKRKRLIRAAAFW